MGWLVVAHILPCHAHTVDMVVHECRKSVLGGDIGCENVEVTSVKESVPHANRPEGLPEGLVSL